MNKFLILLLSFCAFSLNAQTINLQQAIDLALSSDPRIDEKRAFANKARALLKEANSAGGIRSEVTAFAAITTGLDGGFYSDGDTSCATDCEPRDDTYDFNDGYSLWLRMQLSILKPLTTFGRLENYQKAAEHNINVKQQDVILQQNEVRLNVIRAYNGYLTAQGTRFLIKATIKRLSGALSLINDWLDEDKGSVKLSDRFALEAGLSVLERYQAEAQGLESIALSGLSVLTGLKVENIEVEDKRLRPTDLPELELEDYIKYALDNRPEFVKLENGLAARRALMEAQKSNKKPIVFAGIAGTLSVAPGRDRLDNPHIFDQFNHAALSPLIGMKWSWDGSRADAKVEQEKAELDALVQKAAFAQRGIPFQVSEQFHTVHSQYEQLSAMKSAAKSARRWMIASYTDFEAGLEEADKIITAMQLYVLSYADYLKILNDYNLSVSKLYSVTGNYNDL